MQDAEPGASSVSAQVSGQVGAAAAASAAAAVSVGASTADTCVRPSGKRPRAGSVDR